MKQHRALSIFPLAAIVAAAATGACENGTGPDHGVTGLHLAKAGASSQVFVELKQPASAELESFFADVATLDFASAPQLVDGRISNTSLQTTFSPFWLNMESIEGFGDGKDPQSDPLCNTEWFEAILETANEEPILGSLEIRASWKPNPGIGVRFIVAIPPYEYLIQFPMFSMRQSDRLVQVSDDHIVLALRHAYPRFYRRELGPQSGTLKGPGWGDDVQRCLANSDWSNGFMDAEIWVWSQ